MMRGVWFGNKHSYSDFGLILTSKEIPLPEPKTYMIDVPCANGLLDLSTALTGGVINYKNRLISLEFTIMHPFNELESIKSEIAGHLHGKCLNVAFDVDSDFYYVGRCKIIEFNTSVFPATMTIEIDAEPYKRNVRETVISDTISGTKGVSVSKQGMPIVPIITVYNASSMTVKHKGKLYQLSQGENIIPEIVLSSESSNYFLFTGNADVSIKFRGGEL